jgi:hypothetical protein
MQRGLRAPISDYVWRKGYIFHSPEGGRATEAFQSLFSHIDGKIRDGFVPMDGCGRKVVGTLEVDTDPAIALSLI